MRWGRMAAASFVALGSWLVVAVPAHAAVPVLVIDGQGYGHGVGMAQDGAYWMGRAGATTPQILGHFYPGVGVGTANGTVRVEVLPDGGRSVTLTFPTGGEVRSPVEGQQAPGFPVPVPPGGAARVWFDGGYHVEVGGTVSAQSASGAIVLPVPTTVPTTSTTSTTTPGAPKAPATTTTVPGRGTTTTTTAPSQHVSAQSVWAVPADNGTIGVPASNARYRGVVQVDASGGPLRLINQLPVEQYLRGMGEVRDPSWPAASLRAQAIVARTYALRAMARSGELCNTEKCQVYLGQQAEYPAMDRAVADTAGQVLVYRGALAAAVYSANGAGISASPAEGFGTPDAAYPYLRATAYETHSPDPWQARIALDDLATRLHYAGQITGVSVAATGASGRPTLVALDGSAGRLTVAAADVDHALSLRSTKWTVHVELGDAPAPPPVGDLIQALPEQAAPPDVAPAVAREARPAVVQRVRHHGGGAPLPIIGGIVLVGLGILAWWRAARPPQVP